MITKVDDDVDRFAKLEECGRPPCMPIWCCMITRVVNPRSVEGRSEAAQRSIAKELKGHDDRGTWDLQSVREYTESLRDSSVPEAMIG